MARHKIDPPKFPHKIFFPIFDSKEEFDKKTKDVLNQVQESTADLIKSAQPYNFVEKLAEFEKRNVAVVACSTDTEQSHWGWLQMAKAAGGIKGITYPIVADTTKIISLNFGTLSGDYDVDDAGNLIATGPMIAFRGLYLIDKNGVVRHQLINDFPLGRNVDEAIRMVDALQFFEENGEVCPANWVKGSEGMKESHTGVADYLAKH